LLVDRSTGSLPCVGSRIIPIRYLYLMHITVSRRVKEAHAHFFVGWWVCYYAHLCGVICVVGWGCGWLWGFPGRLRYTDQKPVRAIRGPALDLWLDFSETLEGHSNAVNSVAFSPDGTQVVSGSDDKAVRLRHAVTGAALQALEGHWSLVSSVAFSPDGNIRHSLYASNNWVAEGRSNLLWLPPAYLATCWAVNNEAIALGHSCCGRKQPTFAGARAGRVVQQRPGAARQKEVICAYLRRPLLSFLRTPLGGKKNIFLSATTPNGTDCLKYSTLSHKCNGHKIRSRHP
jgi:hypothetical protein